MKKLNGKSYFEKSDIVEVQKKSIFYTTHPDDENEFLYLLNDAERKVVVEGINALSNTLMWEFTSETAINVQCIDRCYKSLHVHSGSMMEINEFNLIPVAQVTSYCYTKLENWLKFKGRTIFFDLLQKCNK